MAISHADHDHPNTSAARAKCRKRIATGQSPRDESAERALAGVAKVPQMTVVPRKRGDGGVVKGLKQSAGTRDLKKPGTHLQTIGDLPNVPRMLAYGVRLAWAAGYEAIVGHPFNDNESRILIGGKVAQIQLVWKPSVPDGVWGIFVRHCHSSITHRVSSVQEAFDAAKTEDAWDGHGNYGGL